MLPTNVGSSNLMLKYTFGCNGDLREDIQLMGDKKLFYTAGHQVVKYDMVTNSQAFLPGNKDYSKITAICVSPKRTFIAVAEKGAKCILTLYEPAGLRPYNFFISYKKIKPFNIEIN